MNKKIEHRKRNPSLWRWLIDNKDCAIRIDFHKASSTHKYLMDLISVDGVDKDSLARDWSIIGDDIRKIIN